MDEQKYWRNFIANEIKAEHDKVRKYYSKQGMNSGGITQEQQVRLNIFALCQSIASTYNADIKPVNEVVPKPRKPRAKKVVEAPKNIEVETTPKVEEKTVTEPIEANNVVDKVIVENIVEEVIEEVVEESGHKDSSDESGGEATPSLQNEFGELL